MQIIRYTLIILFILSLGYIFGYGPHAAECSSAVISGGGSLDVPQVRLLYPALETADIRGKNGILFKWSIHEIPSGGRLKYWFQLYKGYEMYGQDLVFKTELDRSRSEFFIKKDIFENGQVYTWSMRQRSFFCNWSKRSFCSFKVIK